MTQLLSACTGDQSVLLPPQPPARPPQRDFALERANDREHQRMLAMFGGEYRAPATKALLGQILARLAKSSDNPGQVFDIVLLNSSTPNAFALAGGQIYLTRGLLALINDTAEAAAVLAHEMAHVIARHAGERDELQRRNRLFGRVSSEVLNDNTGAAGAASGQTTSLARFSRLQELEADRIGVRLLAAGGYDPYAASRMLTALARLGGQQSGPSILSSHPSNPERVERIISAARQLGAPGVGERDRDAWLGAIDGVAYGSDPREGTIRGRTYINSSLGVTFTAPEGIGLEASTDHVLGSGQNGRMVLRFEGVVLDAKQTLETYAASGWLQGMETSDVKSLIINGNAAAVARGKGSDWNFRLAAVQIDSRIYRFILAVQGNDDIERAFQGMLDSFRKLAADDVRTLSALRLRVKVAEVGATTQSTAALMGGVDRAQDQFLIINGLDRPGPLKAGLRYKIVAE
jgi:predicted Zn-dependent protease